MVVVVIIGLITAVVLIRYGQNRRDTELDDTVTRIDTLFDYVREQAELQTRDYGFLTDGKTYSFVVFDVIGNQWRPVDEDDALRERDFPPGIEPQVVVEGRKVVLDPQKKEEKKSSDDTNRDEFMPQVMIFANGDLSSFELSLQRQGSDESGRIYSDEQSNVVKLMPGEKAPTGPPVRTAIRK